MTTPARVQDDQKAIPLISQVTMAERRVLERHSVVRARMAFLHRRIRDQVMPLLLLSGVGIGFITGEITGKQRARMPRPGSEAAPAPSKLLGAAGTLFALVRAALAVLPIVTAPLGNKERHDA